MQTSEQQSAQLSLALKGAKSGIWDWHIPEETVTFGPNYYRMAGYDPDEFPPKFEEWEKRVHPDDITTAKKTIQQYLAGELDHYAAEFRFKTKPGSWMWILAQGEITERDEAGNPTRFVGLHIDISESKKAEKAFQEERAFSTSLVNTAQMIVLILDIEGRIRRINPYMETITGYKEAEVKGQDWFDTFLPPADHTKIRAMFKKAIVDIDVSGEANLIVTKDGREIMVEWYSKTLKDVDGAIVGLLYLGVDITERLKAEEARQDSEESHRSLFDNAPFPYHALDAEGCFIDVNLNWMETLGYSADEVVGQWYGNFLAVEDQKIFTDIFSIFKKNGRVHDVPFRLRHKKGHYLDILLEGRAGYTPEGDFIQTYCIFQDVSEKKRAEEEIKQSERKFRLLADYTHDWEYWINPEGECIYISPSCERISGYRPDEYMSNPNLLFDITEDKYVTEIHRHYKDESHSENPKFSLEFKITTKNGEVRWLEHNCIPVFDEDGNFAGRRGNNRDITQKKQGEAYLQGIFRSAPAGIGLVVDRKIKWVNQKMGDLIGYTSAELEGNSARMLYQTDEEFEWVGKEKYQQITKFGTGSVDTKFLKKDGSIIDVLLSSTPLDLSDWSAGVVFTALDITERKAAENTIVKAKEEWETTFDAMSDMVTIHDRDMRIVRANKAAHEFFGASHGSLNGKICCEAFWGSETHCAGCPLLMTMKNGEPCSEILSYNDPDKTLLVTTTSIPNGSGQPEYYIHIARDITEHQQLEKEASRATRLASLGELAAGVAHEINNPNALILYNSDILNPMIKDLLHFLEDNPPVDSGQLFGGLSYRDVAHEIPILLPTIHNSAQRIKHIVNDLRDFTRKDSSTVDEVVDVNQVVQTAVRLTHNAIQKATDHFEINLAETLPMITGVQGRLDQVIINLLINACQALENRSQLLAISTAHDVETGQIKILVTDAGQGMSSDVVGHILEPFMTTKREQGGTGLGLSVSARIIKEYHGTLSFKSAPGEGTTATISLPVRKEDNHDS